MQQRVVHFKEEESVAMAQSSRPGACSLKRSKSLSSASEAAFQAQPGNHLNGAVLGSFSPDIKKDLDQAIKGKVCFSPENCKFLLFYIAKKF